MRSWKILLCLNYSFDGDVAKFSCLHRYDTRFVFVCVCNLPEKKIKYKNRPLVERPIFCLKLKHVLDAVRGFDKFQTQTEQALLTGIIENFNIKL